MVGCAPRRALRGNACSIPELGKLCPHLAQPVSCCNKPGAIVLNRLLTWHFSLPSLKWLDAMAGDVFSISQAMGLTMLSMCRRLMHQQEIVDRSNLFEEKS